MNKSALFKKTSKQFDARLKRRVLIMNLTICFLTMFLLEVNAKGFAQNLTIDRKDVALEQVFKIIEDKTEYTFLYNPKDIQNYNKLSISYQETEVKTILNDLLSRLNLEYKIIEKTILVKPSTQTINELSLLPKKATLVQTIISGKVIDENGVPLLAESVSIVRTNIGASTDE